MEITTQHIKFAELGLMNCFIIRNKLKSMLVFQKDKILEDNFDFIDEVMKYILTLPIYTN